MLKVNRARSLKLQEQLFYMEGVNGIYCDSFS